MKTRTIYDILDEVMKDYEYSIKKEGNKILVSGKVTIKKLGKDIEYSKEFYVPDKDTDDGMEKRICGFKEEFKKMIVNEIKGYKELLEDDDVLIDHLLDEIYCYKRDNEALRKRIDELEHNLLVNVPFGPNPVITPSQEPYPGYDPFFPNKIWCQTDTNIGNLDE